eukprot:6273746-Heterocapsa_arctica.AAC.1
MGIEQHVFEAQAWPLKLRYCATWSGFCEESNGDSGDARRPLTNLQIPFIKTFKTFKAIYTCMCTPMGPTDRHRSYLTVPNRSSEHVGPGRRDM